MEDLAQFSRRPDGNAIATFFNRRAREIAGSLKLWGGRFSKLHFTGPKPTGSPFERYCVGGSQHAFAYARGWTVHCDNSTTIASGLAMSVARIAKCVAVRVTFPVQGCVYPCIRLEYHDHTDKEISRVVSLLLDGDRWKFFAEGTPLQFEDLSKYSSRKIRESFTVPMLKSYLSTLGCLTDNGLPESCDVYSM